MKIRIYRYLWLLAAALALTGCDDLFPQDDASEFFKDSDEEKKEAMKVTSVKFSPDYKTFTVTTRMLRDVGPYAFSDSTKVRMAVTETVDGIPLSPPSRSRCVGTKNLEGEAIVKSGLKMLALVDLTLSQEQVDRMRYYVGEARTSFDRENLFVAFIYGDSVSSTLLATDYVMDNMFMSAPSDHKHLYRAILDKRREMTSLTGHWAGVARSLMLVLSDGQVYYNDDRPMDADHYRLQEQLLYPDTTRYRSFMAYYANIMSAGTAAADGDFSVLKVFCKYHHGSFMTTFNWSDVMDNMEKVIGNANDDNAFLFVNPDGKIYRGDHHRLTLSLYSRDKDSLIASTSLPVSLGSLLNPIVVGGRPWYNVLLAGVLVALFIALLLWVVFQLLIPYIRFWVFRRKYVITYTGANMSVGQVMVNQKCYLCKGDFEPGDQVVVKCEHTMHEDCWDENGYHCPEYGYHCKSGAHYYNRHDLLDPRNASFYLRWMLVAVATATVAWCFYILMANRLPSLALLSVLFIITVGMAMLAIRHRRWLSRLKSILVRALVASVSSALVFYLVYQLADMMEWGDYVAFFGVIPWLFTGFAIAYASSLWTRVRPKKLLVVAAVVLGFYSMYVWQLLFVGTQADFRVLLLVSLIIFCVVLALSLAFRAPRSDRYFLHVSGPVKDMDVALYKWFRADPHASVTIGRSIDCSLQLSWDTEGVIEPQHAEVCLDGDVICLRSLGGDVYVDGRLLREGKSAELFPGRKFVIGRTVFEYVEKDR